MEALVVDEMLNEVAPGEDGELVMAGPQVSPGYWRDAARTAAAFVRLPGKQGTYYRTGDRVRSPIGEEPLVYVGRLDHQIKVQGHRVELGEVEAALMEEAGVDLAVALGWPMTRSGADGVVGFIADTTVDIGGLRDKLKKRLPLYVVPREIHVVSEFPLNPNGKVDRAALLMRLGGSA
jgi:acyl-CoA synthetase (AMP-forming)/AMP-acid ligase II